MNILIKSVKIIDANSEFHNEIMDVLIIDGKIAKIAKTITNSFVKEYTYKNLHLSPGWFDIHANFGEPGFEHQETIYSGSNAAIKGGFTGILVMPNNNPCTDNKSMIQFIKNAIQENIVDIIPAGNITKKGNGNEIVEMHDMKNAGCNIFTDDKKSLIKSEVMKIAMLYSKDSDSIIMNFPNDKSVSENGCMHEGIISTNLGLNGIPSIAEEMMIDRDLSLCEYTKSRLHISYISTKNAVKKIKVAKSKGLKVTSDVTIHNLFLEDKCINNFDTRFKVLPPLRTRKHTNALINALKDGTIDIISSDHCPISDENKKVEFDNAAFGIIGLETAFGLLGKHILPKLDLSTLIEKISINPRKILSMDEIVIKEGEKANLTLFNPKLKWIFTKKDIRSKSFNTPFIGEKLIGKALAIYNNNQFKEC
jgi:dihydroorotase